MAAFRKILLILKWGNDVSKSLTPLRVGPCPPLHCPLPSGPGWGIFFAFPAMNSPLPAELKFMLGKKLVLGNG